MTTRAAWMADDACGDVPVRLHRATASAYSILAKTAARLSDNGRRTVAHHPGGKHLTSRIGSAALIPNPALKPFEVLVGEWQTTGSHPYLPDSTLHGRTSFDWLEGGHQIRGPRAGGDRWHNDIHGRSLTRRPGRGHRLIEAIAVPLGSFGAR